MTKETVVNPYVALGRRGEICIIKIFRPEV